MSKILFVYIFRLLFSTTLKVGAILLFLVWVLQSVKFLDLALSTYEGLKIMAMMVLFLVPDLITLLLPIVLFLSIYFTYHHLTNDRELIIMRSLGLSDLKLASPALFMALISTLLMFFNTLYLSPLSLQRLRHDENELKAMLPAVLVQEGVFSSIGPITLFVRHKNARDTLSGVFAYVQDEKPYTLMAAKGQIKMDENPGVYMVNGNRQQMNKSKTAFSMVSFDETILSLKDFEKSRLQRQKKIYELPTSELLDKIKADGPSTQSLKAELNQRIIGPLLTLLMSLLALLACLKIPMKRVRAIWPFVFACISALALEIISKGLLTLSQHHSFGLPLLYALLGSLGFFCFYTLAKGK